MVILCSLTAIHANDVNGTADDSSLTDSNNDNANQEALTTASANDASSSNSNADKTVNKNDNSKNLKTESQTGTFSELKKLIEDADEYSTIYLDKDYKNSKGVIFTNTDIKINKPITIDGQGHTIDANKEDRIFDISANNVVLRNITFMNGKKTAYTHGGLIYWSGKNGLIENCIFKQTHLESDDTNSYGGGIYVNGEHLTIRNCEFNTLKGRYGSAIYLNSKNNIIENCSFGYNYYYNEPFYRASDSLQKNKVPAKYNNTIGGGAIYVDSTGNTIKDSLFAYNLAQEGGAIYINRQNNVIDSCIFYNNRATKNGPAIYVDAKNNKINNNMFYLNNIKDNIWGLGEINDIYSSVKITADKNWWGNVNLDVCKPKESKFMKDKDVKPTTNNDKVTVNNWYYIDVVDKSGNTIPKVITRIGDYAGNTFDFKFMFKLSSGKGDFNYPDYANDYNLTGDKLRIFDGSLYTDKIIKGFTGDSLAFNIMTNELESTLKMENFMFGIDVPFTFKETYPLSRLQEIIDNVWENDTAYIYDNYKYDPDVDADMINGIIVNKTINIDGKGATIDLDYQTRGFYVNAPEVTIKNINIINGNLGNGGMGGAIFFHSKFGEIINATFEGNTADYGGAVAVTKEGVTVTKSTFKNNYANERGAAIYVTSPGLSYTNNLFDSNHAAYGEYACVEGYKMSVYSGANNIYINNSITGIGGKDDDDTTPSYKPKKDKIKQFTIVNRKNYVKQIFHDKITVNGKEIPITNNQLTLDILNQIFNQNFTNGHLLVYIDGKLVFNDTTTDDLSQLIYNLIDLLSGKHEIKVEFTDKEGKTNSYTETITV